VDRTSDSSLSKEELEYARVQWTRIFNDPGETLEGHLLAAGMLAYIEQRLRDEEASG